MRCRRQVGNGLDPRLGRDVSGGQPVAQGAAPVPDQHGRPVRARGRAPADRRHTRQPPPRQLPRRRLQRVSRHELSQQVCDDVTIVT